MGVSDPTAKAAMQHRLLTSVKKAVTQARKTPGATDQDVRKAAAQAVKSDVKALRSFYAKPTVKTETSEPKKKRSARSKSKPAAAPSDKATSRSKAVTKEEARIQKSQPQKEIKPKENKIEESLKNADMSVAKELGIFGTAVSRVAGKSSLLGRFSASRKAEDAINAFADETTLQHINNASLEKKASPLGKQFSQSVDNLAKDAWDSLSKDQKIQSLKKQLLRDNDPGELEEKIKNLKPRIDEGKRAGTAAEYIGGEMVSSLTSKLSNCCFLQGTLRVDELI